MTTITVIDVETTGLDPEVDRVVEISAVQVEENQAGWSIGRGLSSRVNPGRLIPPEASAIHHILDQDVAFAGSLENAMVSFGLDSAGIIAGHNCRFDRAFLPTLHDRQWIDTWRCAMHVWQDAPSFGNCVLFYWLGIPRLDDVAPHSALFDARVTAHVLCRLLAERSLDDLLRLSMKAVILKKVGFGKHFGSLWTEVPTDYLQWASKQDFEPDVKFTIKVELARRA